MIATGESRSLILEASCRLVEQLARGSLSPTLLLDSSAGCLRLGAAPSLPPPYVAAIDGLVVGPSVGSCGTAAYLAEPVLVPHESAVGRIPPSGVGARTAGVLFQAVAILGRQGLGDPRYLLSRTTQADCARAQCHGADHP